MDTDPIVKSDNIRGSKLLISVGDDQLAQLLNTCHLDRLRSVMDKFAKLSKETNPEMIHNARAIIVTESFNILD